MVVLTAMRSKRLLAAAILERYEFSSMLEPTSMLVVVRSALHSQEAASSGHELVCEHLILEGAEVNFQGGVFGNALQAAALNGRTRVVDMLLLHGAEVDTQGGLYSTALLAACLNDHEPVVRLLLAKDANVNLQQRVYANALQAAAINGYSGVVKLLIQYGADVNQFIMHGKGEVSGQKTPKRQNKINTIQYNTIEAKKKFSSSVPTSFVVTIIRIALSTSKCW
jgi:ankyrin repeat protein